MLTACCPQRVAARDKLTAPSDRGRHSMACLSVGFTHDSTLAVSAVTRVGSSPAPPILLKAPAVYIRTSKSQTPIRSP